ncbi:MAG: M28 family peptidase [candidate division Zixibacteria bacterium]|nr:M28 family peptidase [candidate division Zixibacteria bacterium]
MKVIKIVIVVGAFVAAAALALPGELVVISDKEVRPDEAAGLYYLGSCAAGYLYNGSSAAVGRAAPYRLLDRDAQVKDYYVVWAPAWVKLAPEQFAHLGAAARLSEYEILVGLEPGFGPGALRAVEHRIELIKLEPVTRVAWRCEGEGPPKRKSRAIEAAVDEIKAEEYAGYIKRLQDFRTRAADTKGNDAAAAYIRSFFSAQGLDASLFVSKSMDLVKAYYPEVADAIYLRSQYSTIKRTRDRGATWETIYAERAWKTPSMFWVNASSGFVAGYNSVLAKTTDGGDTWEQITFASGYPEKRYEPWALCFADDNTGWICGSGPYEQGFMLMTTDGGYTWVPQSIPGEFHPGAMDFFDVGCGWAGAGAGSGGLRTIFYTDDGGANWRQGSVPGANRIVDLAAATPTAAWAADRYGRLLKTTNGLDWDYANTGIEGYFYNVEFPDPQNGYAAGSNLIKTTDGGATWREVGGCPDIDCGLLAFADKDHGVVGDTDGDHLYRTDDGGVTFVDIVNDLDLTIASVIGERRGSKAPDEIVILGGHFDSTSDQCPSLCPGADDNASGTACAMAAARALKNLTFDRTIRYVAFDAEECGVVGSMAYAGRCSEMGEKIIAFLNADMVAYDEETGTRDDYAIAYDKYIWLFDYLKGVGDLYGNNLIYEKGFCSSDQYSFWGVGYAAIAAIEGSTGGGGHQSYPYYHTTEDTLDKLRPALAVRFVRDYAAVFAHLAGFDDTGIEEPGPGVAAVPFSRPFAVYPNPYCYATAAGGVNFVGIKSPATVEVYDLAGRRVAREQVAVGCDECLWRPAGRNGEALAPGVYLYRVEGREQKKAGKIVIGR